MFTGGAGAGPAALWALLGIFLALLLCCCCYLCLFCICRRRELAKQAQAYERRGGVFDGTPRDTVTWVDFDSSRLIGFGTEKKLYLYEGGENYDITPIVSVVTATNGLNTTAGSTRIVVSVTGIGIEDGNYVAFTSQTTTVGGNIFLTTISDSYEVSVIDAA